MTKQTIIAFVGLQILIIAVILGVIGIKDMIQLGADRIERQECQKLLEQSKRYSDFWLTTAEDMMCRHHNVKIDAPVK
jgi:hypothetical protein